MLWSTYGKDRGHFPAQFMSVGTSAESVGSWQREPMAPVSQSRPQLGESDAKVTRMLQVGIPQIRGRWHGKMKKVEVAAEGGSRRDYCRGKGRTWEEEKASDGVEEAKAGGGVAGMNGWATQRVVIGPCSSQCRRCPQWKAAGSRSRRFDGRRIWGHSCWRTCGDALLFPFFPLFFCNVLLFLLNWYVCRLSGWLIGCQIGRTVEAERVNRIFSFSFILMISEEK